MQITGDVLAAFANEKTCDLLITGNSKLIISTLLNEEIGKAVASIGDVVAVELTLPELATLANTSIKTDIMLVQLNRNAKKGRDGHAEAIPTSKASQATG